ncbi:G2/mitotic-specific cyclin [Kappamyces sp. JEL0680]|nr:G2/mitotic-specific cyclin [Kappamyces sp. JEL0680]
MWTLRGRAMRSRLRCLTAHYSSGAFEVDFLVVGGGVVGLAIARALVLSRLGSGSSIALVEKNERTGLETSARNSQVIHAGLYYGRDSLKTQLCIQGKRLLYDYCVQKRIPHKRTGKLVVAADDSQGAYLAVLQQTASELGVDAGVIGQSELRKREPLIEGVGALVSPSTGIIDASSYLASLESDFAAEGGDVFLQSKVVGVERRAGGGFLVSVQSPDGLVSLSTNVLINAAGLYAHEISNLVYPNRPTRVYYCKGHYFVWRGGRNKVSTLVYPTPDKNVTSLGFHLTMDLDGMIRFGPDVYFQDSPTDYAFRDDREAHLEQVYQYVKHYLPSIRKEDLLPDYTGIRHVGGPNPRPKLVPEGGPMKDFYIERDGDFVNLLGIESPGLTSSLAIGNHVVSLFNTTAAAAKQTTDKSVIEKVVLRCLTVQNKGVKAKANPTALAKPVARAKKVSSTAAPALAKEAAVAKDEKKIKKAVAPSDRKTRSSDAMKKATSSTSSSDQINDATTGVSLPKRKTRNSLTTVEQNKEPAKEAVKSRKTSRDVEPEVKNDGRNVKKARTIPHDDLDQDDIGDPMMVAEYVDEIFDYLRELEIETLPNPDYMNNQKELQWKMRAILVDWLIEVHTKFRLLPETLFLAVNIIDRFLSLRVVSLVKLQLVGVTALFIASKYEEVMSPSIQSFLYMAEDGYTEDEIVRAERYVLQVLKFNMQYPTPMSFLRRSSKADDYDIQTRTLAKYLMEVTLLDHRFLEVPASKVAASAHYLARHMLDRGEWTDNLTYYSGYTAKELEKPTALILEFLVKPVKYEAIFKKYSQRKFMKGAVFVQEWIATRKDGKLHPIDEHPLNVEARGTWAKTVSGAKGGNDSSDENEAEQGSGETSDEDSD